MTVPNPSRRWTAQERDEYERRYEDIETTRRLERIADDRAHHEAERHAKAVGSGVFGRLQRRRD